jgi:hypothetical protein
MNRISTNNSPPTPSPNQAARNLVTPPVAPRSPLSEPPLMNRQVVAQANRRIGGGGANMPSLPEISTPSPVGSIATGLPPRRLAAAPIVLRQPETEEPAFPVAYLNRAPSSMQPHEQDAAADEAVAFFNRHPTD